MMIKNYVFKRFTINYDNQELFLLKDLCSIIMIKNNLFKSFTIDKSDEEHFFISFLMNKDDQVFSIKKDDQEQFFQKFYDKKMIKNSFFQISKVNKENKELFLQNI